MHFTLWLVSRPRTSRTAMLMGLGRLVRAFEFRRPLLGLLSQVWKVGSWTAPGTLTIPMISELLLSCCLLPLAFTDFRAALDHRVAVSDASESGGGACISAGLSAEGLELAREGSNPVVSNPSSSSKAPLTSPGDVRPRVVCVGILDETGALRVALSRLPIEVVGYISAGPLDQPGSKRLIRKRWPGVIEWPDLPEIEAGTVEKTVRAFAGGVGLVLVGARSPCQDTSQIVTGTGPRVTRSLLFQELVRVLRLLRNTFDCPVEYFVENVGSMPMKDLAAFSDSLGVRPYLVDAQHLTYCRRPRYFWCSWDLVSNTRQNIRDCGSHWEVVPLAEKLPYNRWVDAGWEPPESGMLYTFTPALPQERRPSTPAGCKNASPKAKERWEANNYMFQVYQFEDKHLIRQSTTQEMRLPSPEEREVLMGFDRGYTLGAMKDHSNKLASFVTRCQLIGRSSCCSVVGWLVTHLLSQRLYTQSLLPAEICLITGISAPAWTDTPAFVQGLDENKNESRNLVYQYLCVAEKNGSDVRLDVGVLFRPKAWPRAGVRAGLWKWKILHGYAWDRSNKSYKFTGTQSGFQHPQMEDPHRESQAGTFLASARFAGGNVHSYPRPLVQQKAQIGPTALQRPGAGYRGVPPVRLCQFRR